MRRRRRKRRIVVEVSISTKSVSHAYFGDSPVRQLGAKWWKSYNAYVYASMFSFGEKSDDVLYVGWPSSDDGVGVLDMTQSEAYDLGKPFGLIYSARDMDERCRMIEKF